MKNMVWVNLDGRGLGINVWENETFYYYAKMEMRPGSELQLSENKNFQMGVILVSNW